MSGSSNRTIASCLKRTRPSTRQRTSNNFGALSVLESSNSSHYRKRRPATTLRLPFKRHHRLRADRLTSPESTESISVGIRHSVQRTTQCRLSRNGFRLQLFAYASTTYFVDAALHFIGWTSQFPCQKPRPSVHYPSRIRPHQKHAEKEGGSTPSIFEMCAVMRCANYQLTIAPNSTRAAKEFIERFHDDFVLLAEANELSQCFSLLANGVNCHGYTEIPMSTIMRSGLNERSWTHVE